MKNKGKKNANCLNKRKRYLFELAPEEKGRKIKIKVGKRIRKKKKEAKGG